MKYYTLDDVMELKPCHSREKLEEYMKGRKKISLSGILNSKAYYEDKVWLVVRLLPKDRAVEFSQWCANSVAHLSNGYARNAAAWANEAYYASNDAYNAASAAFAASAASASETARKQSRQQQINQLKLIVKENKL